MAKGTRRYKKRSGETNTGPKTPRKLRKSTKKSKESHVGELSGNNTPAQDDFAMRLYDRGAVERGQEPQDPPLRMHNNNVIGQGRGRGRELNYQYPYSTVRDHDLMEEGQEFPNPFLRMY